MNWLFRIIEFVLWWRGSYVACFVPVAFDAAVDAADEEIVSDVKFSFFVEEGFFDVGLYDIGFIGAIWPFLFIFYDLFYLF